MKFSTSKGTQKDTPLSKREDKLSLNISQNSKIIFQVGLIASLLIVTFVIESSMGASSIKETFSIIDGMEEPPVVAYVIEEELPKVVPPEKTTVVKKPQVPQQVISSKITPIENNVIKEETPMASTAPTPLDVPAVKKPTVASTPTAPKNVMNVEFAPVFPGCNTSASNKEKVACMSEKINAFVRKTFEAEKFSHLEGVQTIQVAFKINAQGDVIEVVARAKDKALEKEAIRVVERLPLMLPGKQGTTTVDVLYSFPIKFKVDN